MESQDARAAFEELTAALEPRAGEKVCIGYPHLNDFGANFVESVLRMAAYDKAHGNHLLHNSGISNNGAVAAVWGRSIELAHARNVATAAFMASDSDWLLWIDSDMGFESDALEKLLNVADPEVRPIVGGLAFVEGDYTHDFRGGLRASLAPTLYDWTWVEPKSGMPGAYKLLTRQDWPTDEVIRVSATGTGFLLIHRSVFEKISAWTIEQGGPGQIWFERIPGPDGEMCGEDISFCLRAHQVDIPVYVHTGVVTNHQKTVWYGPQDYRMKPFTPPAMDLTPLKPEQWPKLMVNANAVREAAETSPIREKQVPEAEERVAIIVPVAKRPKNAAPFLNSLFASLTHGQRERVQLYVMTDQEDTTTWAAWYDEVLRIDQFRGVLRAVADEQAYLRNIGSFAEKVNRGYAVSDEPWLFLVGDDVRFHPGWLDQAMEVARTTGKSVVGTNDLSHHPVIEGGEHAVHMFIRRDYVDEVGASWDGPGVVCHEGYRHWFVDNEIVTAAKRRGEWAPCLAAHVEHLHPVYGKAETDEVYDIGREAAEADEALWMSRLKIENEG